MKQNALLLGCGSKWGATFTQTLADNNYEIDLITGSNFSYPNVTTYNIDWFRSDRQFVENLLQPLSNKKYDLIFFNQNTGGGPNEDAYAPGDIFPMEQWNLQNWINCQLPYVVVKILSNSISNDTKVGWMITGLIDGKDKSLWKYAGYASVKSTNVHIMRGFANTHPGIFFALDPCWFPENQYKQDSETICKMIESLTKEDSGAILKKPT